MKRNIVVCLMRSALMLTLTGILLQLLSIDLVNCSYAYVSYSQSHDLNNIQNQGEDLYQIPSKESDLNNILGWINDKYNNGQHEYHGQGRVEDHGDLDNNVLNSRYDLNLNKISDKNNERDEWLQVGHGENNWGQFDGRGTFQIKDDEYKDFHDYDKDRHNNSGKNEGQDEFWGKHEHSHNDDIHCGKKVPEPAMISLLGAGIAGVSAYSFIKRRNIK